nr:unnamed protein product [Naegleria fowleri]
MTNSVTNHSFSNNTSHNNNNNNNTSRTQQRPEEPSLTVHEPSIATIMKRKQLREHNTLKTSLQLSPSSTRSGLPMNTSNDYHPPQHSLQHNPNMGILASPIAPPKNTFLADDDMLLLDFHEDEGELHHESKAFEEEPSHDIYREFKNVVKQLDRHQSNNGPRRQPHSESNDHQTLHHQTTTIDHLSPSAQESNKDLRDDNPIPETRLNSIDNFTTGNISINETNTTLNMVSNDQTLNYGDEHSVANSNLDNCNIIQQPVPSRAIGYSNTSLNSLLSFKCKELYLLNNELSSRLLQTQYENDEVKYQMNKLKNLFGPLNRRVKKELEIIYFGTLKRLKDECDSLRTIITLTRENQEKQMNDFLSIIMSSHYYSSMKNSLQASSREEFQEHDGSNLNVRDLTILKEEIEKLRALHDQEREQVHSQYKSQLHDKNEQIMKLTSELQLKQVQLLDLSKQLEIQKLSSQDGATTLIHEKYNKEMMDLVSSLKSQLQQKNNLLEEVNHNLKSRENEIKELTSKNQNLISELKNNEQQFQLFVEMSKQKMNEIKQEHLNSLNLIESSHLEEIEYVKRLGEETMNMEMNALKSQYETKLKNLAENHSQQIEQLKVQQENLIEDLKKQHLNEMENISKRQMNEIQEHEQLLTIPNMKEVTTFSPPNTQQESRNILHLHALSPHTQSEDLLNLLREDYESQIIQLKKDYQKEHELEMQSLISEYEKKIQSIAQEGDTILNKTHQQYNKEMNDLKTLFVMKHEHLKHRLRDCVSTWKNLINNEDNKDEKNRMSDTTTTSTTTGIDIGNTSSSTNTTSPIATNDNTTSIKNNNTTASSTTIIDSFHFNTTTTTLDHQNTSITTVLEQETLTLEKIISNLFNSFIHDLSHLKAHHLRSIEEKNRQIETLRFEKMHLEKLQSLSLNHDQESIKLLNDRVNHYKSDMETKQIEIQELEKKVYELQLKCNKLEHSHQEMIESINAEHSIQMKNLENKFNELQIDRDSIQNKYNQLDALHQDIITQLNYTLTKLQHSERITSLLQSEKNDALERYKNLEQVITRDVCDQWIGMLNNYSSNNNISTIHNSLELTKLVEWNRATSTTTTSTTLNHSIQSRIDTLHSTIQNTLKRFNQLQEMNQTLTLKLGQQSEMLQRNEMKINELLSENSNMKKSMKQFEETNHELELQLSKEHSNQHDLQLNIQTLKEELTRSKDELQSLQNQNKQLQALKNDPKILSQQTKIQQLEEENYSMNVLVTELKQKNLKLQQSQQEWMEQVSKYQQEINTLQRHVSLQQDIKQMTQLEEEKQQVIQLEEKHKQQVIQLEDKISELNDEISEQTDELHHAALEVINLQKINDFLSNELKHVQSLNRQLKDEYSNSMTTELKNLKDLIESTRIDLIGVKDINDKYTKYYNQSETIKQEYEKYLKQYSEVVYRNQELEKILNRVQLFLSEKESINNNASSSSSQKQQHTEQVAQWIQELRNVMLLGGPTDHLTTATVKRIIPFTHQQQTMKEKRRTLAFEPGSISFDSMSLMNDDPSMRYLRSDNDSSSLLGIDDNNNDNDGMDQWKSLNQNNNNNNKLFNHRSMTISSSSSPLLNSSSPSSPQQPQQQQQQRDYSRQKSLPPSAILQIAPHLQSLMSSSHGNSNRSSRSNSNASSSSGGGGNNHVLPTTIGSPSILKTRPHSVTFDTHNLIMGGGNNNSYSSPSSGRNTPTHPHNMTNSPGRGGSSTSGGQSGGGGGGVNSSSSSSSEFIINHTTSSQTLDHPLFKVKSSPNLQHFDSSTIDDNNADDNVSTHNMTNSPGRGGSSTSGGQSGGLMQMTSFNNNNNLNSSNSSSSISTSGGGGTSGGLRRLQPPPIPPPRRLQ